MRDEVLNKRKVREGKSINKQKLKAKDSKSKQTEEEFEKP